MDRTKKTILLVAVTVVLIALIILIFKSSFQISGRVILDSPQTIETNKGRISLPTGAEVERVRESDTYLTESVTLSTTGGSTFFEEGTLLEIECPEPPPGEPDPCNPF